MPSPEFGAASEYAKEAMPVFERHVTLGQSHAEYYKSFRRGTFPDSHTVGFHWFAPWPSTRRLRWPFGRRGAAVLGWVVTSRQVERGMLTEECRLARDQRLGHETISKTDPARRGWYVGTKYTREATAVAQHVLRAPGIRENPRQGWSPTGEVLA